MVRDIKFSLSGYNDEFTEVYHVLFDDKYRIDISLTNGRIGPLLHRNYDLGMGNKLILFILKWLHYEVSVISKELYLYLRKFIFSMKDSGAMTIERTTNRVISG